MTNEMKLLRAFIMASGYEIEDERIPLNDFAVSNWNNGGRIGDRPTATIEYKVTKKADPLDAMFDGFSLRTLVSSIVEISANPLLLKKHKWIKYPKDSFDAVVEHFMVRDCVVNNEYCLILGVKVSIDD